MEVVLMKTMTCRQLGGACEEKFEAETFEEMAEMSKQHGMEMLQQGDKNHLKAMEEMRVKMANFDAMKEWLEEKKREFEQKAEDNE